jgi:signal transduction histidine kinase
LLACHIQSSKALSPEPLLVRGDQVQLEQVFLNLVLNAKDAMLTQEPGSSLLEVSTAHRGGWCEIAIADNGPGIPEDAMPHLFEAYYSTKKNGLGLGLLLSRTIVSAHGGVIYATNRVGDGAEFRLRFPIANNAEGTGLQ